MTPYYEDASVVLYHGDCRDILPTLEPVDHVITDPPYSTHTHAKQWIGAALTGDGKSRVSTAHKSLGFDPITAEDQTFICAEVRRLSRRWFAVFTDVESVGAWRDAVNAAGLDYVRACMWDKVDGAPQFTGDRPAAGSEAIVIAHPKGKKRWNSGGKRGVYRHAVNAQKGGKPHPSTKPEPLMVELIVDFTDAGEIILDPYMGSGTTLAAAKRLGRRAIGIESQELHCETAARRLSQGALTEMFA